jgi:hypothetical protein
MGTPTMDRSLENKQGMAEAKNPRRGHAWSRQHRAVMQGKHCSRVLSSAAALH